MINTWFTIKEYRITGGKISVCPTAVFKHLSPDYEVMLVGQQVTISVCALHWHNM